MMRITERADRNQRLFRRQQPHDRVNLGNFQRLIFGECRQDRGYPFGQHALTRSRRPYQKYIMPTGSRNFKRTFCLILPFYVGIIQNSRNFFFRLPNRRWLYGCFSRQMAQKTAYILYSVDHYTFRKRCFRSILAGHIQFLKTAITGCQRHRQHSLHRSEFPLQTQFT